MISSSFMVLSNINVLPTCSFYLYFRALLNSSCLFNISIGCLNRHLKLMFKREILLFSQTSFTHRFSHFSWWQPHPTCCSGQNLKSCFTPWSHTSHPIQILLILLSKYPKYDHFLSSVLSSALNWIIGSLISYLSYSTFVPLLSSPYNSQSDSFKR